MNRTNVFSVKTLIKVGISVGIITLFGVSAQLLVRNLHRFLDFAPDFEVIFRQISTPETKTVAPWFLLTLSVLPAVFGVSALWKRGVRGKISVWFVSVVAVPVWGVIAVLFTQVNGIFLFDVVRTLLPLLQGGVL